jgi:inosine/xanthosine triphosphatase
MPASLSVAVGSLRAPKVNAIRAALDACGPFLQPVGPIEIVPVDVPSGVRPTPLSSAETMQGAKSRAQALRRLSLKRTEPWQYFVGLEGGLDVIELDGERRVFLESWAYVLGEHGRGHYGQSGAIPLPEELASRVVDEGVDLSEAIDRYAGAHGIRNGLGAWGVLTHGLITREDAFRIAAINAFSPFFQHRRAARPEL